MRRFVPVAVFLAVAVAGLLAAGFAWMAAQDASRIKFEATADDALNRIQARLDQHLALLNAAQGFFLAHDGDPTELAFNRFVRALDMSSRYAGMRAIGYAPLIHPGDEAAAEAGFSSNFGLTRKIWPELTSQDWRAPVSLLSPLDERNASAIGFDMYSEPARREAMLAALDANSARATSLVQLIQAQNAPRSPGFLVYLPIPDNGNMPSRDTVSALRPVRGFIYASFRAAELFSAALSGYPRLPVAIEVHDVSGDIDQIMYRSPAYPAVSGDGPVTTRSLVMAGRTWLLYLRPTTAYSSPGITVIPVTLAILGALLAAALALLARAREKQFEVVAELHRSSEKSLMEKDLMLQEMKHRIKNSIARVLAIARQTASGAGSIEEFSSSFSARLQAMAASQDMLTRSYWQKADLAELLRTELEQVFGKVAPDVMSGPQVSLDERATQALGLTFHELATNALKYGEQAEDGSQLRVSWEIESSGPGRRLKLVWEELSRSGGTGTPGKVGFGTRLIDMNIARELGGRIDRHYGEKGLTIRIAIPLPET